MRILRDNLLLKIISLATAIMIWTYVGASERSPSFARDFMAEVQPVNAPPDDVIVTVRPDTIPVTVSGPKDTIDSLAPTAIKALVDLSVAQIGMAQLPIVGYQGPPGVTRLTFDQKRRFVAASVVEKLRKRMPVTISYTNRTPAGTTYSPPRLDPAWVDVVGAKADVDHVAKLVVYVDTEFGSVRRDLAIKALDKPGVQVPGVHAEPATTRVELDLVEAPATRTLVVSALLSGKPAPPMVVSDVLVDPPQITVTGRPAELVSLTNIQTVDIPVDGIKADAVREVNLLLPPSVAIKDGEPVVKVTIKLADISKPAQQ